MPLIAWKSTYETGVPSIDEQHKLLLGYINKLEEAKSIGSNDEAVRQTIINVVNYTKTHFADEEKLMAEIQYPYLSQHQAMHAKIISQVIVILERMKSNQKLGIDELLLFLRDWFINHVIDHDKQISLFIQSDLARKKKQAQ
jgi:hemerythrin-like metal-binding protein